MDFKANTVKEAAEILNREGVEYAKIITHSSTIFFYFLNKWGHRVADWSHEFQLIIEPIPVYVGGQFALYNEVKVN
jgi:hypothetical protein